MNLIDLKQVLDERSEGSAEHVMQHVRLHGVRAKVVSRRRRRAAAWGACVLVAVVGVVATVVPGLRTDERPPPPAATPSPQYRMIEGFPEYADGTRVIAAKAGQLPQRRIELTIVPRTLDLVVLTKCDDPPLNGTLERKITVNGKLFVSGTCHSGPTASSTAPEGWQDSGVAVGKKTTLVMTITGASRYDDDSEVSIAVPEIGGLGMAVAERVPFERYPLPPRPAGGLKPLESDCVASYCRDGVVMRSDPTDPMRPVTRTVTWREVNTMTTLSQTPGVFHIRINGFDVMTAHRWDYEALPHQAFIDDFGGSGKRKPPRSGDQVTVEVVPEYATGAWEVVLSKHPMWGE